MSLVFLTESQLHNLVSKKNKAFMTRTINKQKKCGNTDIFSLVIDTQDKTIQISLGESQAKFVRNYRSGNYEHDFGYLYNVKECTEIVNEVAKVVGL